MDVSTNLNPMRFSPVALAILSLATTLGFASPIEATPLESSSSASQQFDGSAPLPLASPTSDTFSQPIPDDFTTLVHESESLTVSTVPATVQPQSANGSQVAPPELLTVEMLTSESWSSETTIRQSPSNRVEDSLISQDMDPEASEEPMDDPDMESDSDPDLDSDLDAEPDAEPGMDSDLESDDPPEDPSASDVEPTPTDTPDLDLPTTPPPAPEEPAQTQPEEEPRVLVSEVVVVGADLELQQAVYNAIATEPGRTATRTQLQDDINAIFATGLFQNVRVTPEDTPLGVRVTFEVEPNPILRGVEINGNQVLPDSEVQAVFAEQYGEILNLRRFQDGIAELNDWYQANGYILAQVIDAPDISDDGIVTLEVAEGEIEDINIIFLGEDGETVDEDGEPIEGRTREFIITREFETQPGDVFNEAEVGTDLQRVFGLGIFEDVQLSLVPGDDPRKVDLQVNIIERNTGSIAAGLGFGSGSGVFGTLSYQEANLGGNNQRFGGEIQAGLRDLAFDISFTDPWIGGDPYRTSYTVNAFRRRTITSIFDGGEREITLPDPDDPDDLDGGDRPRVVRLGGGVRFNRALDEWLGWEGWSGSLGFQYQQVSIRDEDGDISPEDTLGNDLSFSGDGTDDLFTVQLGFVNDQRNNSSQPTRGSVLRFGTEQSIPIGQGSIFFNRLRASYSYYIPVEFTDFSEGNETLAINVQGGTVLGDLPPYEAFALGGTDSVRGYDFGDLGSGRSFLQATAEYRFPVFSIIGGALFLDYGTDLGTGSDVLGEPAEAREKPGSGFGYGFGLRIQSPLGAIRIDYGFDENGDGRFHFGVGERF